MVVDLERPFWSDTQRVLLGHGDPSNQSSRLEALIEHVSALRLGGLGETSFATLAGQVMESSPSSWSEEPAPVANATATSRADNVGDTGNHEVV